MSKDPDVTRVLDLVRTDGESAFPKFPDAALHILADEDLQSAISDRLRRGFRLTDIRDLGYNIWAGLNHTVFCFEGSGVDLLGSDILVISNANCAVVGRIDNFVAKQPNQFLPEMPKTGVQPFVLAIARKGERPIPNLDLLAEVKERTRAVLHAHGVPDSLIDGDGPSRATTRCSVLVPTKTIIAPSLFGEPPPSVQDYDESEINDDCG